MSIIFLLLPISFPRQEMAEILGFRNYAHMNLDTMMAKNQTVVMDFLENLKKKNKPIARKELSSLKVSIISLKCSDECD